MSKVKNVYEFLDQIAPFEKSMSFDNTGLLVGNLDIEVKKALIALDITKEVCGEAFKFGAQLIISHHPIIFNPLKKIEFDSPVALLVKYGINAICAHTNLDVAAQGVNFHLAKTLNLENISALITTKDYSLGIIGSLPKSLSPEEFAQFVKKQLSCEGLRYTQNSNHTIKTVAVCSGSGGEFVINAKKAGADAFVTGEIKHSQILLANQLGITVVDAGHFKTENVIINPLKLMLEQKFKNIKFKASKTCCDEIKYL